MLRAGSLLVETAHVQEFLECLELVGLAEVADL
jgi:hypothetical protein